MLPFLPCSSNQSSGNCYMRLPLDGIDTTSSDASLSHTSRPSFLHSHRSVNRKRSITPWSIGEGHFPLLGTYRLGWRTDGDRGLLPQEVCRYVCLRLSRNDHSHEWTRWRDRRKGSAHETILVRYRIGMLITIGLELQNSYSSAQKTISYVHIGTLVDSTHRYKHLLAWFSTVLFDKATKAAKATIIWWPQG